MIEHTRTLIPNILGDATPGRPKSSLFARLRVPDESFARTPRAGAIVLGGGSSELIHNAQGLVGLCIDLESDSEVNLANDRNSPVDGTRIHGDFLDGLNKVARLSHPIYFVASTLAVGYYDAEGVQLRHAAGATNEEFRELLGPYLERRRVYTIEVINKVFDLLRKGGRFQVIVGLDALPLIQDSIAASKFDPDLVSYVPADPIVEATPGMETHWMKVFRERNIPLMIVTAKKN